MPAAAAWGLSLLLMVVGLVGTLVPCVPGTPVILAGAVLHKVFLPQYLSWWTVAAMGLLAGLGLAAEFLGAALGSKSFGSTRWGLAGAAAGAFVGLFFGPVGLALGAVLGAACAEVAVARRPPGAALKAGLGAGIGLLASFAGHILIALTMTAVFILDCLI
ncbi:MAG: DUF456 domain-containing protein [Elusimicrobia bacterium]|nr:DUF456 domain-containing protein [Elusimicrobiota bacterium]